MAVKTKQETDPLTPEFLKTSNRQSVDLTPNEEKFLNKINERLIARFGITITVREMEAGGFQAEVENARIKARGANDYSLSEHDIAFFGYDTNYPGIAIGSLYRILTGQEHSPEKFAFMDIYHLDEKGHEKGHPRTYAMPHGGMCCGHDLLKC